MRNSETINIVSNNSEIEGVITHRSDRSINVEIITPYTNLSKGSSIPTFARPYQSFDGEYGDSRAKDLLGGVYTLGKYIDENFSELQQALTTCKQKIAELENEGLQTNEFKVQRKTLRSNLKSGVIDNKQYQEKLSSLRNQVKESETKVNEVMDSFFVKNFPETIPVGLRQQVIDILEGKQDFRTSRSNYC